MIQKNTLSVLALLVLCLSAPLHAVAQQDRPNIVFILMDNLGYGELGVYGGGILRGAPTPRIDQLASEGMRLLNFDVQVETPVYCRFYISHNRSQTSSRCNASASLPRQPPPHPLLDCWRKPGPIVGIATLTEGFRLRRVRMNDGSEFPQTDA